MINIKELIYFIKNYKINNKFTFYKDCIDKLNKINKDNIHKINKVSYILEPLRLYCLANINKYDFVLSKYKYKNFTYLKLELNKQELNNLLLIIALMELENSNILKIKDINIEELKNNLDISDKIYLNVIEKNSNINLKNYHKIINYYDTLSFLFGIESINMLKYYRFDRLKDFIINNQNDIFILQKYNEYLHKLSYEERDKYIINKGVLTILGTINTNNIDIIVFILENKDKVNKIINNMNEYDIYKNIIDNYGDYYTKINDYPQKYKKQWLTYQLPSMDKAKDIYDVHTNPVFYINIFGMKFININLTIYSYLNEASITRIADLLMLKDINNINIYDKLCLPNMTIKHGRIIVYYGKYLEEYFNKLQNILREKYNKEYTIDKLQNIIKHCSTHGYDIYKGEIIKDPDTDIIKYYHIMIKKDIIKKYALNANYLLDIGTGKLTDMRLWNEFNIKNVIGIEPSIDSIKLGFDKIKKIGFIGKIEIINGVGDEDWTKDNKYKNIYNNIYDVITFQFTIHYMINNIDKVINNIKNIMNNKCKIIITCMDGNKIHDDFKKYKQIEVRNKQEPIFAIIPLYDVKDNIPDKDNDILVYFKGAYGVSSGSIEPIIDINKLIDVFKKNKINLINKTNFSDYNINIKSRLNPTQLRVSSYYMSLIFEYNSA